MATVKAFSTAPADNRSQEAVTAEISGGDITESFDVEASSHLNFSTAELAETDELILIEGDLPSRATTSTPLSLPVVQKPPPRSP